MQTAKTGDTVLIDFVVRTNDGRVVGNTEQDGPQTVTLGGAQIFPQIEAALDGMEVGAEVGDESVTADGNHPLAGEDLHFGVTLVEIKPAA